MINENINKVIFRHKNGLPLIEANTLKNKKHGKQTEWLSDGQKFSEEIYINGMLINSWCITDNMNEEETLRYELKLIREKINALHGVYLNQHGFDSNKSFKPIKHFINKQKYPRDYQIFMEVIGELHIESESHIIEIHQPIPFNEDSEDYWFWNYLQEDQNEVLSLVWMGGNGGVDTKPKNYMVVAADNNANTFGYYIGEESYIFANTSDIFDEKSLSEWFITRLNQDLGENSTFRDLLDKLNIKKYFNLNLK